MGLFERWRDVAAPSALRKTPIGVEALEPRSMMAADGHMRIGMNLENVVDWSPAWTFTDVFKASRGWIAHAVNTVTGETTWDVGDSRPIAVDADGNPTRLAAWTNSAGQAMRQMAGTLMFREIGGRYPGGIYRAEWEGTGRVTFGFDAEEIAVGRTADGRAFADLRVSPSDNGILMRVEETSPIDPVRNFHVWMPDWQGERFAGQRWQPGASFSPFHPLFRQRLSPFGVIRFMQAQETNTSDIRTWADRRDAADIRQGSGSGGSPSEPIANGMSLEYMVQLANDLDADPWFNMPHMADDTFVRNFAIHVRDHLEPGRRAYVEWSNEIWNFAWGFEASQWVQDQARLPVNAGLSNWQVAGREAKRDLDIWSQVFAGQEGRIVRVAAGWAANAWVTNEIVSSMDGSFDAIAIAPYVTPTDDQRDGYTTATTVDRVLADTRTAIADSVGYVRSHRQLADTWTARLGRDIQLVAYEGGPHLDGRNAAYQEVFHAATNDPRMGDIQREYLRGLDAAGLNLYVDFVFTGNAGASSWGDFAKLHRMDEPLENAHRYNAVVAAATGGLWGVGGTNPNPTPVPTPVVVPPPPVLTISSVAVMEGTTGRKLATFAVSLSEPARETVTVKWSTVKGTATAGRDYQSGRGTLSIRPGQQSGTVRIWVFGDRARELDETFFVNLASPVGATLAESGGRGTCQIRNDDGLSRAALAAAFASVAEFNQNAKARK